MKNKKPSGRTLRSFGLITALISLFGITSTGATVFLLAGIQSLYFEVISHGITLGAHIITLGGSIMLIMRNRYGKAVVWFGAFILLISSGLAFSYSLIGGIVTIIFAFFYFILAGFARI